MSAFVTLSSGRLCLRRCVTRIGDAFAAMNADARVMEFFRRPLRRAESDAMGRSHPGPFQRTRLWFLAIEVPGVVPLIGFRGTSCPLFSAPFMPCVEVGWRRASSIGDTVMQRRRPD